MKVAVKFFNLIPSASRLSDNIWVIVDLLYVNHFGFSVEEDLSEVWFFAVKACCRLKLRLLPR